MPIYKKLPEDITEVDVVVAGGGTAGCVVAGRLAEADPTLSILVIEYGKDNYDVPSVVHPALFVQNIAPGSDTSILYETELSPELNRRTSYIHTGGVLGGGSSINLMMYTRAQRDDFDSWKTEGWNTDELIPYLKKLESYYGESGQKTHGYDGPVEVSSSYFTSHTSKDDLLQAAARVGYPPISDLNDLESNNGFGPWYRYVSRDGKRQDAAHTHLHPLLRDGKHPNLHVLTETKVARVLFDEDRKANAVEFVTTTTSDDATQVESYRTVRAKRQVVVSCGAIASPAVLERSGIGKAEVLQQARIQRTVANVSGVGHNYQDHHLVIYPYKVKLDPGSTLLELLNCKETVEAAIAASLPLLGWNAIDVAGKLRPTNDDVAELGPQFQSVWAKDFQNHPNRPLALVAPVSTYVGDPSYVKDGSIVSMATYSAYPYSRGSVHVTSADATTPPRFVSGFFTDKYDVDIKVLVWAYKKQREIMRRTKMYRGELAPAHPAFAPGSAAACTDHPLDKEYDSENVTDIAYTAEDNNAIEKFLRDNVQTCWHSLGTCKMASRENNGVVDKNLDVYGVQNLKVIDLSIVPENVGANTCNTAMVIGEKGADILIKELGLGHTPA